MALYLLISEGTDSEHRVPIFATGDPAIIAAVGREIARKLGADSPVVNRLRIAHVPPSDPKDGA
jgi:hypothetical protein